MLGLDTKERWSPPVPLTIYKMNTFPVRVPCFSVTHSLLEYSLFEQCFSHLVAWEIAESSLVNWKKKKNPSFEYLWAYSGWCTSISSLLMLNKGALLLRLLSRFSRGWLFVTPKTAAHQAPLSPGFSRQEHWSGLPLPSLKGVLHAPKLLTRALCVDNGKLSPYHLLKSFLLGQVCSIGLVFRENSDNVALPRCPVLMGGL